MHHLACHVKGFAGQDMHICSLLLQQGSAMYAPEKEALVWKIKNFPGGKEFILRCKFGLPSVMAEEEQQGRMPPVRVNFEIPYFTVSGIQVGFADISFELPLLCNRIS